MFIFKKVFSQFLFPLPLVVYIFLAALVLLWFTRKQKTGKILVSIGVFIFIFLSYSGVPNILLKNLERQYDTLNINNIFNNSPVDEKDPVQLIVVLGGGHTLDPGIPLTSKLNYHSLVRLIEGVRIYREIPGSKLLLSGMSVAKSMADVAKVIGVNENDIIVELESNDTKDQAKIIKYFVNKDPFILVTSASHMPRSMALFKKLGMNPIPMPAGYRITEKKDLTFGSYFPKGSNVVKAEEAFYEYLGLAWARLRGQI